MRETPKDLTTTLHMKLWRGSRLITEPDGNNVKYSTIMDNPQCYYLNPLRQDMVGIQRLNGCWCAMIGLVILSMLKIQSRPTRESVYP